MTFRWWLAVLALVVPAPGWAGDGRPEAEAPPATEAAREPAPKAASDDPPPFAPWAGGREPAGPPAAAPEAAEPAGEPCCSMEHGGGG